MKGCVGAWNAYGIYFYSNNAKWENGVLWENTQAAVCKYYNDGQIGVLHSVIRQLSGVVYGGVLASQYGDYNVFDLGSAATVGGASYSKVADWQKTYNQEWHSTAAGADLANPTNLDFHPKSVEGRWDIAGGLWVTDEVQSVCIDMGNPASAWTNEPEPNGGRMNVGAHGNVWDASKSRTNAWLRALTYNDGGTLIGASNTLYWTYGGFEEGAEISIQYSTDLGASWVTVAADMAVTNGMYVWDVNGLEPMACYWRVVSEDDTNVWDRNDQRVGVSGGRVTYYVNDTNTVGDVYCAGV